jgi:hypothetical protein
MQFPEGATNRLYSKSVSDREYHDSLGAHYTVATQSAVQNDCLWTKHACRHASSSTASKKNGEEFILPIPDIFEEIEKAMKSKLIKLQEQWRKGPQIVKIKRSQS